MQGTSMSELYEYLTYRRDAEFIYDGTTYVIQPEISDKKSWLVIWMISDMPKCICKREIPPEGDIPKDIIDAVLSDKCFDGKSFVDIEKFVEVTVIY
ncbi:MAG: hypothetical protein E7197_07695 [Anaerovibrio sp.]|uniref:hypothetical protein n=1 Tax=Anaerovibrio sp. TaxID=1872532 RepID=UPI0025BF0C5B|nr:hypothetical protein [Anaerovibrio sp.]MBE6099922.1 hypothetical protein [Anaerovibrio sp.]